MVKIADYKHWILNALLDKYEQSQAFQTGIFNRRILITVSKEAALLEVMEQVDEKHLFIKVIEQLKDKGYIDYSWVKYEVNNLLDQIWLIPDAIDDCYMEIGRIPAAKLLELFLELAKKYLSKLSKTSDFAVYIESIIEYTNTRKKLKAPFTSDMELNEKLFKCIVALDSNQIQMERVFSTKHFGDSKFFEHNLKTKVISILKEIEKNNLETDDLSDEDLLIKRGLYRWPEIYEFKGPVTITMDDGSVMDMSVYKYGAYINSEDVKHILAIDGSGIKRVVFIENKANYIDYMTKNENIEELVIYHGGFYSPIKGMLFSKIYEGCEKASFYHWSDIDLGGFKIFNRLKTNIISELHPLYMDVETLKNNEKFCIEIKSREYTEKLNALKMDKDYQIFHDVIMYMIEKGIRLEQENLILE